MIFVLLYLMVAMACLIEIVRDFDTRHGRWPPRRLMRIVVMISFFWWASIIYALYLWARERTRGRVGP